MTGLAQAAADMRRLCAMQCYNDWHGYYMLRRLVAGAYQDVRPLTRAEALDYRCKVDEAVEVVWTQTRIGA